MKEEKYRDDRYDERDRYREERDRYRDDRDRYKAEMRETDSSDDGDKKRKQGPLSDDQRDKLLKQREQYEVAAEKLEDQLLKLKQQREALKSQGHKHEDNIMKENA